MRTHGRTWTLSLAVTVASLGLLASACSDDEEPIVDAGPADTGVPDTGTPDTGTPDTGTPDTGSPDLGPPDTGIPPGIGEGLRCPGTGCQPQLGCVRFSPDDTPMEDVVQACLKTCTSDEDCAGSLIDPPASTCSVNGYCVQELTTEGRVTDFTIDIDDDPDDRLVGCPDNTTPVQVGTGTSYICYRLCGEDADCAAGSELTPPATSCFTEAEALYGLGIDPGGICVQERAGETEEGRVFRTSDEQTLAGCAEGLRPLDVFGVVSPLASFTFGCIRECATDGDCTGDGLGYCNRVVDTVFTSTNTVSGICTSRRRTAGEPCSRSNASEMCSLDAAADGHLFCADGFEDLYDIERDTDPIRFLQNDRGYCHELCGNLDFDDETPLSECASSSRQCVVELPTNEGTTANVFAFNVTQPFGIRDDSNLGICIDPCDDPPDTCTAPGFSCDVQVGPQNEGGPNQLAFCVGTREPVLPMWDPFTATGDEPTEPENCAGRSDLCPEDAICINVRTNQTSGLSELGFCGFRCRLDQGDADCQGRSFNGETDLVCERNILNSTTVGVCLPRGA